MGPVVQKVESAIHRINLFPVDSAIGFPNTYPLDRDLSDGYRYPAFEQLAPGNVACISEAIFGWFCHSVLNFIRITRCINF